MSKTYQYTELVGTSTTDFSDAVNNAIAAAREKHPSLRWFEVIQKRGYIDDTGVAYYQAHLKIGFSV